MLTLAMFVKAFLPLLLGFAFCSEYEEDWSYRGEGGPFAWPSLFENCSESYNKRQSPIDLPSEVPYELSYIRSAIFYGYEKTLGNSIIMNTGKTIEIIPDPLDVYRTGDGNLFYRLINIHCHWGSEHTVAGTRYPLEIHFVHINEKCPTLEEAMQKEGCILVIVVFYSISASTKSPAFAPITEALKDIKYANTKRNFSLGGIPLSSLFPPKGNRCFYFYNGSLTTPECNPVVTWIVYYHVQGITYNQLEKFYGVYESEVCDCEEVPLINNYRLVQRRNGRVILASLDCW